LYCFVWFCVALDFLKKVFELCHWLGFQGESLLLNSTLMACAKHFAAYGAAIGMIHCDCLCTFI
jgi:hypothetical protein